MSITVLPDAAAIEETTSNISPISIPLGDLYDLVNTEVTISQAPSNGSLEVGDPNTLTYTPEPGFEGTEELAYAVCTLAEPILCDESTITIVVTSILSETGSNDLALGAVSSEAQSVDSAQDDSRSSTMSATSIGAVGAVVGAFLVLAGSAAFMKNRHKVSTDEGAVFGQPIPLIKRIFSSDNTEASSLSGSKREVAFTGTPISNLSSGARSFFGDGQSSSEVTPASPANSLFSVSSSASKRSQAVDDIVDL